MFFKERGGLTEKIHTFISKNKEKFGNSSEFINYAIERAMYEIETPQLNISDKLNSLQEKLDIIDKNETDHFAQYISESEKKMRYQLQTILFEINKSNDQLMQNILAETKEYDNLLRDELHNQLYASYTYISELYRLAETIRETQGKTETEHYESTVKNIQRLAGFIGKLQTKIDQQFANLKPKVEKPKVEKPKEEKQSGK